MGKNYSGVLHFWFEKLEPEQHFRRSDQVDNLIHERFSATHAAAARGELFAWRDSTAGRLAEIIVLDQFSRNLYREDARAYACDGMALALAQEAVRAGADRELSPAESAFLYMPYMHSESLRIHEIALKLFSRPGLEDNLKFERRHQAIMSASVVTRAATPRSRGLPRWRRRHSSPTTPPASDPSCFGAMI